jgi:hypothetical protein
MDSEKSSTRKSTQQEEFTSEDDQGIYRSLIRPLNSLFGDMVTGSLEVTISADDFVVQGQVFSAPANTIHFQFLTSGPRCPDQNDDRNQDGIIDLDELLSVSGKVLIPLDSDLSEQLSGIEFGPIANSAGKYVYRESTSHSLILSDLLAEDPDRTDIYQKLRFDESLNLAKRVVIILGVKDNTVLPTSYKNPSDLSLQESVPIACGELSKVKNQENL